MPAALLDGVRIAYVDAGAGEVLVLLHGVGDSSADWEEQLPLFSTCFRVIAPDLRGYGASERRPPFTVERHAADVWALLERLGIEDFDLVGHSMGSAVALQMAVEQPQRVRRLVVANALPSFRADTPAKYLLFLRRWLLMAVFGPRRLSASIARSLFPRPDQAALRARVAQRGGDNDRGVYLATIRGLLDWSVEDRLARLTMPVLVLASEFDYFPRAEAERFAARIPGARLQLFARAHHALPLERPEAFNAALLAFLQPAGAATVAA